MTTDADSHLVKYAEDLAAVAVLPEKTANSFIDALKDPAVQRYLGYGLGGAGLGALLGYLQRGDKKKRNALSYGLMGGMGGLGLAALANNIGTTPHTVKFDDESGTALTSQAPTGSVINAPNVVGATTGAAAASAAHRATAPLRRAAAAAANRRAGPRMGGAGTPTVRDSLKTVHNDLRATRRQIQNDARRAAEDRSSARSTAARKILERKRYESRQARKPLDTETQFWDSLTGKKRPSPRKVVRDKIMPDLHAAQRDLPKIDAARIAKEQSRAATSAAQARVRNLRHRARNPLQGLKPPSRFAAMRGLRRGLPGLLLRGATYLPTIASGLGGFYGGSAATKSVINDGN